MAGSQIVPRRRDRTKRTLDEEIQLGFAERTMGPDAPEKPLSRVEALTTEEIYEQCNHMKGPDRVRFLQNLRDTPATEEEKGRFAARERRRHLHPEPVPDRGLQRGDVQPSPEGPTDPGDSGPPSVRAEERDVLVARDQEAARARVPEEPARPEPSPDPVPEAGGELRPGVHPGVESGGVREAEEPESDRLAEDDPLFWILG